MDGSSLGSPDPFRYVSAAAGAETAADTARITGLSPTSGDVAGGAHLVITGSGLFDAASVSLPQPYDHPAVA